jgi:hypothetical protein
MATFPDGTNDDIVDAAVWGLLRLRQGNLIHLGSDLEDEEFEPRCGRTTTRNRSGQGARVITSTVLELISPHGGLMYV